MTFHARVWISRIADALNDIFPELHREILKYYGMISVHHLEKLHHDLVKGAVSPRTPKKPSREAPPPPPPPTSSATLSGAPKPVKPAVQPPPPTSSVPLSDAPEPATPAVPTPTASVSTPSDKVNQSPNHDSGIDVVVVVVVN